MVYDEMVWAGREDVVDIYHALFYNSEQKDFMPVFQGQKATFWLVGFLLQWSSIVVYFCIKLMPLGILGFLMQKLKNGISHQEMS